MKNGGTVSGATALVNCGCACVFLGELPTAELLFSKAAKVFQCLLPEGDLRFAALYNDMAMLFAVQGEAEQAESYFGKAIAAAQKSSEAQAHEAGIWLNLAGLAARTKGFYEGEEEISDGIARAMELLEREEIPGDREYAWLCRSYAPVFERFGYGMHGEELLQRARSICAKLQNEGRLPL